MQLADLLATQDVLEGLRATSKMRLLTELALYAGRRTNIASQVILDALLEREDLGSTGMGNGIAIPHTRLAGIAAPIGILVQLRSPIAFDAIDEKPVDLVFLLLLPERESGSNLNALACIARQLRDSRITGALRVARGAEAIRNAFVAGCLEPGASQQSS